MFGTHRNICIFLILKVFACMNINMNMYEILTPLLFQSGSYKKCCVVYSSITVSSGASGLFVSTKPKKTKEINTHIQYCMFC